MSFIQYFILEIIRFNMIKKRRQKQIRQVADGVFGNSNFQNQHPGDRPEGKRSRKPQVRFISISR